MQHDHAQNKLNFYLLTPRVRGSGGKIFDTIFLHFVISFNLIWNIINFGKMLNSDLLTPPQGQRGSGCLQANFLLPCCCIRNSL